MRWSQILSVRGLSLGVLALSSIVSAGCGSESREGALETLVVGASTVLREDSLLTLYVDIADLGGSVAYLSSTDPYITIVDKDGVVTRQFGAHGEGPGEIRVATSMDAHADTLFLWDPFRRMVSMFDTLGNFLSSRASDATFGGVSIQATTNFSNRPGLFRRFDSLSVMPTYPTGVRQPINQQSFALVALNAGWVVVDTAWVSTLPEEANVLVEGKPTELLPTALWSKCAEDELVVYDPIVGVSSFRSPQGVEVREVASVATPVDITEAGVIKNVTLQLQRLLLAAHMQAPTPLEEEAPKVARQSMAAGKFPTSFNGFVAVLCDAKGRLWLEEFSLADSPLGTGRKWTVTDANGVETSITLPADFRLMLLRGGRGYGVQLDSTGADFPAWVEFEH